jgi:hypothetical protein
MKVMDGKHIDGSTFKVEVECIAKPEVPPSTDSSFRYFLRMKLNKPSLQNVAEFPALISKLLQAHVTKAKDFAAKAADPDDDDDDSTEEEEARVPGHRSLNLLELARLESSRAGGESDDDEESPPPPAILDTAGDMEPQLGPLDPLEAIEEDAPSGGPDPKALLPSAGQSSLHLVPGPISPALPYHLPGFVDSARPSSGHPSSVRSIPILPSDPVKPWQALTSPRASAAQPGKARRASFQLAEGEGVGDPGHSPSHALHKDGHELLVLEKKQPLMQGGDGGSDAGESQSSGSHASEEAGLKPATEEEADQLGDFKVSVRF